MAILRGTLKYLLRGVEAYYLDLVTGRFVDLAIKGQIPTPSEIAVVWA